MNDTTRIAVFSLIACLISLLLFPVIIKIFRQLNWFDSPGTHKIHSSHVPSMGGLAILAGSMISLLMGLPLHEWLAMKYFFISIALMFLIGLRDDVLALSPRQKLISQFLPIFVLVILDNVRLTSFYELLPLGPFPDYFSFFVSILTVVIITNAYNLIDGIDGLAGAIGLITLLFFGIWFYWANSLFQSLVALSFAGGLLAFLFFNWQPSKIFMGDTGALTIGLLLSYFGILFINTNYGLPVGHPARFTSSVSTAVCVLIIPLFDTLRVIIIRLSHLQSPFHADQNHLHHRLLALGLTHAGAVSRLAAINILFVLMALLLKDRQDYIILPLIIVICLVITAVLWHLARKRAGTYA